MRFCGTRGGKSFKNVQRPEPSTGSEYVCPTNFSPCSADTSFENTICVSNTKLTTDCPIITALFVKTSDYSTSTYPTADYNVYEVDDDYKFITSTTKGDNLPLTSFKLETKPCLDHNDVSRATNAVFYPLERDRLIQDCQDVEQFSERYDTRYTDLGLEITEYDVQDESEVLDTLEDLPNYSLYVSSNAKKNIEYGFWARSTIPWSLECEDTHPRDQVIAAANFEKEKAALNEVGVIVVSAIAYGVGFLATLAILGCFLGGKCHKSQLSEIQMKVPIGVCIGIQFILFVVAAILVFGQKGELAERETAMEELSFVNGCGDQFTQIPDYFLPEIEAANGKILYAVIATVIQVILALVTLVFCVCPGKSDDDDSDDEIKYEQAPLDEEEE